MIKVEELERLGQQKNLRRDKSAQERERREIDSLDRMRTESKVGNVQYNMKLRKSQREIIVRRLNFYNDFYREKKLINENLKQ